MLSFINLGTDANLEIHCFMGGDSVMNISENQVLAQDNSTSSHVATGAAYGCSCGRTRMLSAVKASHMQTSSVDAANLFFNPLNTDLVEQVLPVYII